VYTIGIDVGGTNTDGTVIGEGRVLAVAKVPTDHGDLVASTKAVLDELKAACPLKGPVNLQLSTTLTTNTIVEGRGTATAAVVIPGPGVDLRLHGLDFPLFPLPGYVDHRGRVVAECEPKEAAAAAREAQRGGAEALAIVGKFSQRNPSLEQAVLDAVHNGKLKFSHISVGHKAAPRLGFPRRVVTAHLNSQVAKAQRKFADAVESLGEGLGSVRILKADGGTMTLAQSRSLPIESILSGPAASTMAALALTSHQGKSMVVVDIGGTTTDLAVIVQGQPLYAREGAVIGGYPTAVPAILSRSIGLGGDSEIHIIDSEEGGTRFRIGPSRAGSPVCLGGTRPTPTDAVVALGRVSLGDRSRAVGALKELGARAGLSWEAAAERVVNAFVSQLCATIHKLYGELEGQPVYTLAEFLETPHLRPEVITCLGTPAPAFMRPVGEALQLPLEILPHSASANAIGAAAARPTIGLTLYADTALRSLSIPEMGIFQEIERPALFDQRKARDRALGKLREYAREVGLGEPQDMDIVSEESFNIVRGFYTVGRIFHMHAQIRPSAQRITGEEGVR
jgi:N-methylhydantoinase A/oxoprolinase/acetone carboxylase beta subunit